MTAELYSPAWQAWHKWTNDWSTRALFGVFAHLGVPQWMLDLGCADGHLVKVAAALGVPSMGMDIGVKDQIGNGYTLINHDLTTPVQGLPAVYDLVISWEVAEHLPASAADTFCDSLAGNVSQGGHLVFTAARPDQGGYGHINEQPQEYWREKLEARGLRYEPAVTNALRSTWLATTGRCWWYPQNVQVFSR